MRILSVMGLTLGLLISEYNYESINEINLWKTYYNVNNDIIKAVENVYFVSMLRNYIPLTINLSSDALVIIMSFTFDLLTDQDILLMTSIFNPESVIKDVSRKSSTNTFDIMLYILVNNVIERIHLNEVKLLKFRSIFKEKYIFKIYNTRFIYINVDQQVFRLTLPEYIYFGFYVYIRDKPTEADFEKKVKCIIKTAGSCNYDL